MAPIRRFYGRVLFSHPLHLLFRAPYINCVRLSQSDNDAGKKMRERKTEDALSGVGKAAVRHGGKRAEEEHARVCCGCRCA